MTGDEAIELETQALKRINRACPNSTHFPQFIRVSNGCLYSRDSGGTKLPGKGFNYGTMEPREMRRLRAQMESIVSCLDKSKVRHLDMMCKNMAYNEQTKTVALFDFDIATIDDKPTSEKIAKRLNQTHGICYNQFHLLRHRGALPVIGW